MELGGGKEYTTGMEEAAENGRNRRIMHIPVDGWMDE